MLETQILNFHIYNKGSDIDRKTVRIRKNSSCQKFAEKNIFIVDIATEFPGRENIHLQIPPQAEKLKLFDCVFESPPPGSDRIYANISAYRNQNSVV